MMKSMGRIAILLFSTLVAGSAWSQAMPGPGGAQPELRIRMIAIEGTTTGGSEITVANSLRGLRSALERLDPADTFTEVARREAPVRPGEETMVLVNSQYRLGVKPMQPTEAGGITFGARVEQRDGARVQNAIITEGEAAPGQAMIFRGLEGPTGGELILVMQFVQEQDESQSGGEASESDEAEEGDQQSQSEQEQSEEESEEEEEQEPQPQPESEGEETEEEQPQPEPDSPLDEAEEGDEDAPEPEELDNLEAILESLEDMDNREQMEMRNRPRRVQSAGDWW